MAAIQVPAQQHCVHGYKGKQRLVMPGAALHHSRPAAMSRRRQQALILARSDAGYSDHATVAQRIASGLMACTASSLLLTNAAMAEATVIENFTNKCMGCHYNGGNVVAAGATLFPEDLRRNGVSDSDSIYSLIYSGKGKMPGFGADCKPKGKCTFGPRLSDAEIRDLTQYTLDKATAGWK